MSATSNLFLPSPDFTVGSTPPGDSVVPVSDERTRLIPFTPTHLTRPRTRIGELCDDIWVQILSYFSPFELVRISRTSRRFQHLCSYVGLWEDKFGSASGSVDPKHAIRFPGEILNEEGERIVMYDVGVMKSWVEAFGKLRKSRFCVAESLWSLGLNDERDGDGAVGVDGGSLLRILQLGEEGDFDITGPKGNRLVRRAERRCCSIRHCMMGWGNVLRCGVYFGLFVVLSIFMCVAWPLMIAFYAMQNRWYPTIRDLGMNRVIVGLVAVGILAIVILLCWGILLFRIADEVWYVTVVKKRFDRCDRLIANVVPGSNGRVELDQLKATLDRKWKGTSARWMTKYSPIVVPLTTICLVLPTYLLASILKSFGGVGASLGVGLGIPVVTFVLFGVYVAIVSTVARREKFLLDSRGDGLICTKLLVSFFVLHLLPAWGVTILQFFLTVYAGYGKDPAFGVGTWTLMGCLSVWLVCGSCLTICGLNKWLCGESIRDLGCWRGDDGLFVYVSGGGLVCCCAIPFVISASLVAGNVAAWGALIPIGIAVSVGCCCLSLVVSILALEFSPWKQYKTKSITQHLN